MDGEQVQGVRADMGAAEVGGAHPADRPEGGGRPTRGPRVGHRFDDRRAGDTGGRYFIRGCRAPAFAGREYEAILGKAWGSVDG